MVPEQHEAASGLIARDRQADEQASAEVHAIICEFSRYLCRGTGPSGFSDLDWEDVAQEAFGRYLAKGRAGYRGTGSERSYLYTIVKSTLIQLVRSGQRRRKREMNYEQPAVSEENPDARLEVAAILGLLDEACRELLERAFLDGASYQDLAAETGLVVSSVRSKVSRCLQRARDHVS